jgi:aspartate carbamoyltransferase catalytic subunit
VAGFEHWPGVEVATTLADGLRDADAVMALRVQLERGAESFADYVARWRLDDERMATASPGAPLLHPGPTNEGVELTAELASGPRSLIGRQVENGVPIRMAVLALVCGAA